MIYGGEDQRNKITKIKILQKASRVPQNEIWLKLLLETHTLFWGIIRSPKNSG